MTELRINNCKFKITAKGTGKICSEKVTAIYAQGIIIVISLTI